MNQTHICNRCLYTTNHPLGLIIDEEGICSGCRIHEEKDQLDWGERWNKLKSIIAPYRVKNGKTWDCIIPVTGGNDSYFIVYLVKEKLGLNPLLVTYNKYYNTPLGIRNLANLRIRFNCDILIQNVNPISVRNITRTTLREFGSIYWHCHAGQTAFPVQTAVRYKIPLIIWGAHQGLEQVGMFSHEHEVEMTRRYRKDHDLMGYEADDLLSIFDTLTEEEIWQYRYPDDDDLNSIGVRGIYLGNYVRWDPKAQHELMIAKYDYRTTKFTRTFDCYDHVDCYNFMDIHDQIKFYKHGYSKVTDHASREIRHGRLSRSEAITLVEHYENAPLKHIDKFSDWLSITPKSLQFIIDQHRSPKYWTKTYNQEWHSNKERHNITGIPVPLSDKFICNSHIRTLDEKKYITIGKGHP